MNGYKQIKATIYYSGAEAKESSTFSTLTDTKNWIKNELKTEKGQEAKTIKIHTKIFNIRGYEIVNATRTYYRSKENGS